MEVTNIHEAKTHFSKLLERVEKGQEVIIGRAGKPVARIVPYIESKPVRKPGIWKGKVKIKPGFYKADKEIEKMFYGEDN
jgi:prevent-host-death family protein